MEVTTRDGRVLSGRVDEPKGDPGNTLSRNELESKFLELASFRQAASEREARRIIEWVWDLENCSRIGPLFAAEQA